MINTHAPLLTIPRSQGVSYADIVIRNEMELAMFRKVRILNEESALAAMCAIVNVVAIACLSFGWLFLSIPFFAAGGALAYEYWKKINETNTTMRDVRKLGDFYISEGLPPVDATAKAIDTYMMNKTDFEEKVAQATKKKNIFEISRGEKR